MSTDTLPLTQAKESDFHFDQVIPIAGAHFIHDIYTAYVAPLLPVIIDKLSLSLTAAGSLTAIMQLPAVLNPFIGYLADKVSLRYFVILAPAVTATLIGGLGFANSYFALALILFATGVSVAAFHAPAPAMIGRVSGHRVGLGMSLYMAGGELARAAGPLIAVWAVSAWTLEGIWRTSALGWAASLVLYLRLRNVSARGAKPASLAHLAPVLKGFFLPLTFYFLFRNLLNVSLTTFLPTFMSSEGASLALAGASLSIVEIAGVGGALLSGPLSDRLGRKPVLMAVTVLSSLLTLLFLQVDGWLIVPVLLALGFTAISAMPIVLAMVQDQLPNNRAMGNGLLMVISFLLQALAMFLVGLFGDLIGLRATFTWSALIGLLGIPAILFMPGGWRGHPQQ
jgi:FSR family fosmidomycin resistance protein-like MFS transporter